METTHPTPPPARGRPLPKVVVVVLIVIFAIYAVHVGQDVTAAVAAAAALGYAGVEASRRLFAH